MALVPGGLNFTHYSRLISRPADYEIHYVQLNVIIAQTLLPLRLAAAAFLRAPWDDGTCPRIAEMVVEAIPIEIQGPPWHSPVDKYFIHLRTLHTSRMMESSCTGEVPNNEQWCTVSFTKRVSPLSHIGVGQAQPPEPGEAFAAFPSHNYTRRQSP